jgi:ring-1,2-phenylacetyl-CoA epoxidase subunit PaaE
VLLLSQQHDEESGLFKKELEGMTQDFGGRFRWMSWLSEGGKAKVDDMVHHAGRLNNRLLEDWLGRLLQGQAEERAFFYICGPESFMRMATFTLRLMGYEDTRIRKEHFTVEYVPPPPLLTDTTPKKVTILAGDKTYYFETAWPKTILQAALDNHIPLPYSCKGGRCSSCAARCIKGAVKMSINEVLTEKDIKEGLVLTCVGYAETEVELQF